MIQQTPWRALLAEAADRTVLELSRAGGETLARRLPGRSSPEVVLRTIRELLDAEEPLNGTTLHDLRIATDLPRLSFAEREHPPTALVTTARLREVLSVPTNAPDPLEASRFDVLIEVPEHVRADGSVVAMPQLDDFVPALEAAARTCTACAVCLAHAPAYPVHEQLVLSHVFRAGFAHVAAGYDIAPELSFAGRLDATLLDAQAMPVVSAYLGTWRETLGDAVDRPRLRFIGANLQALDAEGFRGRTALDCWNHAVAAGREVSDDADDAALALAGARESVPLASRSHIVAAPVESMNPASLSMIVANLRTEAFAELRTRRVRDEDMAWNASAVVGINEEKQEIDVTRDLTSLLALPNARLERIEVTAIEDL